MQISSANKILLRDLPIIFYIELFPTIFTVKVFQSPDFSGFFSFHVNSCFHLNWYFHFTKHSLKSVHIRSFFAPYFLEFRLDTGKYGVSLHIQSKCGKMRARKIPNMDNFYVVELCLSNLFYSWSINFL